MSITLSTNGLVCAVNFPASEYEIIHEAVTRKWSRQINYEHYSGAWNALAYRFHSAIQAGETLNESLLKFGSNPEPAERHKQEDALFAFFSTGFSSFESFFYGAFIIGYFLAPGCFPIATAKDQQRISPSQTLAAYKKAFTGDPVVQSFEALISSTAYQEWREIRNILTHRTAPGRIMYVSIGTDEAPPTEWKLNNIVFDYEFVPSRLLQLSNLIKAQLEGLNAFLFERISSP